jgi:hypothetical protein
MDDREMDLLSGLPLDYSRDLADEVAGLSEQIFELREQMRSTRFFLGCVLCSNIAIITMLGVNGIGLW